MRLGLIGFGNIGRTLLELLARADLRPAHLAVLVRPGREAALPAKVVAVTSAEALLSERPDLVIECGGHSAVAEHGPKVLRAGVDMVQVSVGALADAGLEAQLRGAAQEGGARLILPAGAVGGLDLLSALSAAGDLHVTYRGIKPPKAWAGSPAEEVLDLDGLAAREVFFRGSAREAARAFPKNANVAAALALAGAGFEATQVELIADPAAPGNLHEYDVRSPVANYAMQIENLPSADNVKTSVSTVYSVLREIRNRMTPVVI
ncbi:aspartate dehydrogenase [Mameliella alba]|nr:aspartate dehydrogenase [Mameliella alba]MBY6170963.1 aspartate dehydrogenase [Mameliella alba]MBY6176187.1 aspartate dehydrogenase [Mameliella alba]